MSLKSHLPLALVALIAVVALVAPWLRPAPTAPGAIAVPRVVTLPGPVMGEAALAPAPTVVTETFVTYLDDLAQRFHAQQALDIFPIIAASEAGEVARGQYVPTLDDPISPGFTTPQLATRWMPPDELRLILQAAGWPEEELDKAYRVARCEAPATLSDGPFGWLDVLAVGPGYERGLFQLIPAWFNPEAAAAMGMARALFADFDLFDPLQNAIAALVLWNGNEAIGTGLGWTHWECHNQGLA
jgi:hypothetical protein